MVERFTDDGKSIYDFLFEFFVECPQCSKFAVLKSFPDEKGSYLFYEKRSLVCENCGFIKPYKHTPGPVGSDFPLWLKAKCCGETLWAYNLQHLNHIESYVRADIRSNFPSEDGWKNSSMISRLPKWIKDGSNRSDILKCIEKLKKTVPTQYLILI